MNGLIAAITAALLFILSGCQPQPPTSALEKTAYQWEKANMDADYQTEQKLLYEPGTFDVYKTAKKINSGLRETDVSYQIFFDENNDWCDVVTTYINPIEGNTVHDVLVIRQKNGAWKVDANQSSNLSQMQNEDQLKQIACINCNK